MERMYDLVEAVRERVQPLGPSVVVAGYGHVGDVRSLELILPRTLVLEKLHSIVCTCCLHLLAAPGAMRLCTTQATILGRGRNGTGLDEQLRMCFNLRM